MDITDYLKIFKDAFFITWKKKILLIFGFFAMIASGGNGFFFSWKESEKNSFENFSNQLINNGFLIAMSLALVLIILFLLLSLRLISQAAIIYFVGNTKQETAATFSTLFKKGRRYLWKLLLLDMIIIIFLFLLFFLLVLPVVFLFSIKSNLLALLVGTLAVCIFIPLSILAYFVKKFAYIYIILSRLSIGSAVESAYTVFKNNLAHILLFTLFLFVVGIISGFSLILILFLPAMPFLLLSALLSLIFSKIGLYFSIGLGILIFGSIFILFQTILETFSQVAWVLFFKKIAGIKIEEETVPEMISLKEPQIKPESA